ncbi:MAG: hypothetical protein ACI9UJ_001408 [bacterium]|jgi:hypothetical protein
MNNVRFTHELIKGRIAEIIFSQMLRGSRAFNVIDFGYEKTIPELTHLRNKTDNTNKAIEAVRRAPDFAVLNLETHEVTLIEVKYMNKMTPGRVNGVVRKMETTWKQASLFIATPVGFFYDTLTNISKNKGRVSPLEHKNIPLKTQEQYLKLLNEFIG